MKYAWKAAVCLMFAGGLAALAAGCGADNDKTAIGDSGPVQKSTNSPIPSSPDAYADYAKKQASGGTNPYGKKPR